MAGECKPEDVLGNIRKTIGTVAPGIKSSEFIAILIFVGYMALSTFKVVSPGKAAAIDIGINVATDAVPAIMTTVQKIVNQFGDQTLLGGIVWAYLKRRSGLKKEDIELQKLNAAALIEKYKAYTAMKGR
jgi:hypothetical protein